MRMPIPSIKQFNTFHIFRAMIAIGSKNHMFLLQLISLVYNFIDIIQQKEKFP
jgi:hypothetical protein